jgi:hypothetical protein
MNKTIKLLQKIYKLNTQLKIGKANPYPIINLIEKHRQEICQYLGIDSKSTFQEIEDKIKQINYLAQ